MTASLTEQQALGEASCSGAGETERAVAVTTDQMVSMRNFCGGGPAGSYWAAIQRVCGE